MCTAENFGFFDDIIERIEKEQEDLPAVKANVATKVTCPDYDTSDPMRPQARY
ncbi:hypothetical protein [Amycolatopsis sp. cmx-4-54]|uniref:hypothetical protein n=1 Tax=Amycolatopsis sp. cmx-4-54 TaxID=2790936 RepID=UPI00397B2836